MARETMCSKGRELPEQVLAGGVPRHGLRLRARRPAAIAFIPGLLPIPQLRVEAVEIRGGIQGERRGVGGRILRRRAGRGRGRVAGLRSTVGRCATAACRQQGGSTCAERRNEHGLVAYQLDHVAIFLIQNCIRAHSK